MLEHISEEALQKYQERSLSAAEVLSVCDHLESCPPCRERLAATGQLNQLHSAFASELKAAPSQLTAHILPEEMIAYVDSELAEVELEIADAHLSFCSSCSADLQDLRDFKASLPGQPMGAAPIEKKTDPWLRALRFWRQPAWGLALQAATLALLVFFLISTRSLKNQVSELQGRLSAFGESNNQLQQQVETLPELQSQIDQLKFEGNQVVNDSTTTESLNDNGRQVAIVQGELSGLEGLSSDHERLIKKTLSQQQIINKPLIPGELIPKKEQLMGFPEDEKFYWLLSPTGKIIESDRPTLNWQELAGATSYSVTVYDADSNPVAKSSPLSATSWTLPEPLKRGEIYIWEVTALKEDKEFIAPKAPAPQAKFQILEQHKYQELNRIRRTHNSHLLLGTLYAQAGLLDDAESEFKALLEKNRNSQLAKNLLASVQRLKPKKPQARAQQSR